MSSYTVLQLNWGKVANESGNITLLLFPMFCLRDMQLALGKHLNPFCTFNRVFYMLHMVALALNEGREKPVKVL